MGEGAADAVDIAQEIQDNIKDGVLESQVRAYLMQAKRWECADPKCELTVEITDREYGLIVQTSWEPINVGQDVKFKVSLSGHMYCVQFSRSTASRCSSFPGGSCQEAPLQWHS